MARPAGRVGDRAMCQADAHGCSSCVHAVEGPATGGSQDVLINDRAALRTGDPGSHSSCCGSNSWSAGRGAPTVLINGHSAHRKGDATVHCGGSGTLVSGSGNVLIGDPPGNDGNPSDRYDQGFILVDEATGAPLAGKLYRIKREDGSLVCGRTDADGRTLLVLSDHAEQLVIEILA